MFTAEKDVGEIFESGDEGESGLGVGREKLTPVTRRGRRAGLKKEGRATSPDKTITGIFEPLEPTGSEPFNPTPKRTPSLETKSDDSVLLPAQGPSDTTYGLQTNPGTPVPVSPSFRLDVRDFSGENPFETGLHSKSVARNVSDSETPKARPAAQLHDVLKDLENLSTSQAEAPKDFSKEAGYAVADCGSEDGGEEVEMEREGGAEMRRVRAERE